MPGIVILPILRYLVSKYLPYGGPPESDQGHSSSDTKCQWSRSKPIRWGVLSFGLNNVTRSADVIVAASAKEAGPCILTREDASVCKHRSLAHKPLAASEHSGAQPRCARAEPMAWTLFSKWPRSRGLERSRQSIAPHYCYDALLNNNAGYYTRTSTVDAQEIPVLGLVIVMLIASGI